MNLAGRRVFASFSLSPSWENGTYCSIFLVGSAPDKLQHEASGLLPASLWAMSKSPFHFCWQYICCQVYNEGICKTRRPRPSLFIGFLTKIWFSAKQAISYSRSFLSGKGRVAYLGTCTKSSLPEAWRSDQRTSMRPFQTCRSLPRSSLDVRTTVQPCATLCNLYRNSLTHTIPPLNIP